MIIAKVKNWTDHQHYKDRSPPWIKLQRRLLDDFDFQCLPIASKALAPMIWLLASESRDGEVRIDPEFLAFRLRWSESDVRDGLTALIDKGFLIVASGALADCLQDACLETETETEGEREDAPVGAPPAPQRKPKGGITLTTYLAECEAKGVKAIPEDDAVFAYAERVGLPVEFLALAWQWFRAKYGPDGTGRAKRYTDWRATFRNAVKDGWPKFWAIDQSGEYYLTTAGKQAQREYGDAG